MKRKADKQAPNLETLNLIRETVLAPVEPHRDLLVASSRPIRLPSGEASASAVKRKPAR